MRFALILSIFSLARVCYGQTSNTSYVHLYSDTTLYGKSVVLVKPILGKKYVVLDSNRLKFTEVQSFQNNKGHFANVGRNFLSGVRFAARVSEGEINLYKRVDLDLLNAYGYLRPFVRMYFDTDSTAIRNANYSNLKPVLTEVVESTRFLNRYRTKEVLQNGLYAAGGVVAGAGMIKLLAELTRAGLNSAFGGPHTKANTKPGFVLLASGSLALMGSYYFALSKHKHLKQAVDAYNKDK